MTDFGEFECGDVELAELKAFPTEYLLAELRRRKRDNKSMDDTEIVDAILKEKPRTLISNEAVYENARKYGELLIWVSLKRFEQSDKNERGEK